MGLFDDVTVHPSRLPAGIPEWLKNCPGFQTYDLGRGMGQYELAEDGCLYLTHWDPQFANVKVPYRRKTIELYASNLRGGRPDPSGEGPYQHLTENGENYDSVTLLAVFRDGKLKIRIKHITSVPAHKMATKRGNIDV